MSKKKGSDEIELNFSSIKKTTKNAYNKTKKVINTYPKITNVLITLFILALLVFSTVSVRSHTSNLTLIEDRAFELVADSIINDFSTQIRTENPQLSDQRVRQLAISQFEQVYAQQRAQIDLEVEQLAQRLKEPYQNDEGQTYLLGIDEYLFFSETKWYLRNGFFGQELNEDGRAVFTLRKAPLGMVYSFQGEAFIGALIHRGFNLFGDYSLETTQFHYQTILMVLVSILGYFLTLRITKSKIAGFTTGFLITLLPAMLSRTMGGSNDSDAITVIFPLLAIYLAILAISAKDWKLQLIYSTLLGISMGLFSTMWSGWWFGFDLAFGIIVLAIIFKNFDKLKEIYKTKSPKKILKEKVEILKLEKNLLLFLLLPLFLITAFTMSFLRYLFGASFSFFTSLGSVLTAPLEPLEFLGRLTAAAEQASIWPNVLRTVAELRDTPLPEVIASIAPLEMGAFGSFLLLALTLIGIIFLILNRKQGIEYSIYGLLLIGLLVMTIILSLSAVRFTLFVAFTIALGVGAFIGLLIKNERITNLLSKIKINTNITKTILVIGILLLIIPATFSGADRMAKGFIPMVNDQWVETLDFIKEDSEEAIITSWWDFGHWFQALSERSVTFDGGDQGKRIHWVGLSLLTDSEQESIDILRMLHCGNEKPSDLLEEYLKDTHEATFLIKEIVHLPREQARERLSQTSLTQDQIEEILSYSHCENLDKKYYVIASEDMVGKAPVWGHFGSWDFTKAHIYYVRNSSPEMIQRLSEYSGKDEQEIRNLFQEAEVVRRQVIPEDQWIGEYSNYLSSRPATCQTTGSELNCDFNVLVGRQQGVDSVLSRAIIDLNNPSNTTIRIRNVESGTGNLINQQNIRPAGVVFANQNGFSDRVLINDPSFEYEILVFDNNQKAIMSSPSLTKSVFTQLFFLEGGYLENFEKVYDVTDARNQRILTYEIKYE